MEDNTPSFDDKKLVVTVSSGETLFHQGFEDYSIETTTRVSTAQAKSGNQSALVGGGAGYYNYFYKIPAEESRNYYKWSKTDNCVAEAWFYDDTTVSNTDSKLILNDTGDSGGQELLRFYISLGKGTNYEVRTNNGRFTHTTVGDVNSNPVKRATGWHQVVFDMSEVNKGDETGVRRVYLDGNVIYEESYTFDDANYIQIGGLVGQVANDNQEGANILIYYDEINAYDVTYSAQAPAAEATVKLTQNQTNQKTSCALQVKIGDNPVSKINIFVNGKQVMQYPVSGVVEANSTVNFGILARRQINADDITIKVDDDIIYVNQIYR